MKALLRSVLVLVLSVCVFACTEVPPYINYSPDVVLKKDTCHVVAEVPDAQPRNAMVEDVSGVRCVNCPEAADIAHSIDLKYPGRVVVATLHPKSNATLTTAIGNDTFNTDEAENIFQTLIKGDQGLPTGSINRRHFQGEPRIAVKPNKWMTYAEEILSETSLVNIELEASVDSVNRVIELDVKTAFIEDDPTPAYLTIMVLESGIVQPQAKKSGVDDTYEHEDILRFTHTNYSGLLLSDSPIKGQVCEKTFDISIPEKHDLDHITIAVLVNKVDADNTEVLQCTEVDLSE